MAREREGYLFHIPKWNEKIVVAGIFLVAFLLRLAITQRGHVLQGDEGAYLWLGKTLVTGGGFTFFGRPELHYTPLYPAVSGLIWLAVRDLELASKICFVIFGALLAVVIFSVGRRLYDRNVGVMAALLVAVMPAFSSYIYFYGSMTEPLYYCLSFAGVGITLYAMDSERLWAFAAAGALFGLSYLTRPEGWLFMAVSAPYVIAAMYLAHRRWEWRAGAAGGVLLGCFILVALPYLVYLRGHLGHWVLTGKTWIAYAQQRALMHHDLVEFDRISWELDSTGTEVIYHSADKFTRHSLFDELRGDPRGFLSHVLHNLRSIDSVFLSKRVLPFFVLPLIGLGLFGTGWSRPRLRRELYLAFVAILSTSAMLVFSTHLRFYLGTLIILVLWLSRGIAEVGRWLQETVHALFPAASTTLPESMATSRQWGQRMVLGCIVALASYYLAVQPAAIADGLAHQRFDYEVLGQWLAARSQPDQPIMSRGAIVAIHAGRPWVPFPHASYDRVLAYARANGVHFWVVNRQEFEETRPQLAFLADPTRAPAELELVGIYEKDGDVTVVYRQAQ